MQQPAYFDGVTVLCIDVANFRKMATRLHVTEVIVCLDELVTLLTDRAARYSDIYRIQTAGTTLMSVAGDHLEHVSVFSLAGRPILDKLLNSILLSCLFVLFLFHYTPVLLLAI